MLDLNKIITIKNLRKEQPFYEFQVRVDRTSPLGNPFVMHEESERDQVCDQYEKYFNEQIKDKNSAFVQELRRLYKILKKHNKLQLYCWCAPKRCHAETIKKFLLSYYVNEKSSKEQGFTLTVKTVNVPIIKGSVLSKTTNSSVELVVQQVNCLGVMSAGLAKYIRNDITDEKFENYKQLCLKTPAKDLLGKVLLIPSKSVKNRIYANIFAQENIGTYQRQTDYTALKTGLTKINKLAKDKGYRVKLPYKLGCGLGGGDWNIVYSIINEVCDECYTTIYELDSSSTVHTICGTGHRPADLDESYGYNFKSKSWQNIISKTKSTILSLNPKYVISGMALGFDQALAISVLQLQKEGHDIKLIAAIPCKDQEKSWSEDSQKLYKEILKRCYKVKYVSDKPYTDTCMMARNRYMVDNSQVVIAMYTGKAGGTANTISYAESKGVKVINLLDKEPISTSHEPKIGSFKGDRKMKINGLENLEKGLHPVSELVRKDYLDNPKILNKYFRYNNHDIEIAYIPASVGIATVRADFNDPKLYKDKDYNPKDIENWTSDKLYLNLDASDDAFRDNDNDNRNKSGYEIYIQDEVSDTSLPQETFEELYRFCIKAIKKRLVMLLDAEKVVDQLVNILKYTNGLSSNCTSFQASNLINTKKALSNKLHDKKLQEFIKTNNDFSVFAKDELTRNDYIETYQRVLRKLTNINDSNLDFIRDIISNKEDSLEDEIIANDLEKETISLNSNSDIEIKC